MQLNQATGGAAGWLVILGSMGILVYMIAMVLVEQVLPEFQPVRTSLNLFHAWRSSG